MRCRSAVVGGQQPVIGFEHFGRTRSSNRERPAEAIGGLPRIAEVGQRFAHRHQRDRRFAAIAQFEFGQFPIAACFASLDRRILVFGPSQDLPRLEFDAHARGDQRRMQAFSNPAGETERTQIWHQADAADLFAHAMFAGRRQLHQQQIHLGRVGMP